MPPRKGLGHFWPEGPAEGGIIDVDAESQRLRREIDKLRGLASGLEKKLSNERFLERAPSEVVNKERERQEEYRVSLGKLDASLEMLTS